MIEEKAVEDMIPEEINRELAERLG